MAETTVTSSQNAKGSTPDRALKLYPALIVAAHPRHDALGERLVLGSDGHVATLGRTSSAFEAGVLDLPNISRSHVTVTRRKGELWAVDGGSRNGSFCNGERFEQRALTLGDVLRIGDVVLLFDMCARVRIEPAQPSMVCNSAAMVNLCAELHIAAQSDVTVLLQGPTGSGKEVMAREVHQKSGCDGEFVSVNCAALLDSLIVSELFGHAKGAFSGADASREGLVAASQGGTLFLDEIGDAPMPMQTALLRLLEQREYRRVGDSQVRKSNARFVSATHLPLAELEASGVLRSDLFYRLSRWTLTVPPLCERREDIIGLAPAIAQRCRGAAVALGPDLMTALLRYGWPGNVRELSSVIEKATIVSGTATTLELTESLRQALVFSGQRAKPVAAGPSAAGRTARINRPDSLEAIRRVVSECDGNMRLTAERLGVSRATLYRWLDELGGTVLDVRDDGK